MNASYEELKAKYEAEEKENQEKQQAMMDSIALYFRNYNATSPSDRQGKYKKAFTSLWEKTFMLIRWYVLDASCVKTWYIEADEEGFAYLQSIVKTLTVGLDRQIVKFMENGGETMELISLSERLKDKIFEKWADYSVRTCKNPKERVISYHNKIWTDIETRPVPPAKL